MWPQQHAMQVIEAMGMLPNIQARWYQLHSRFLNLQAEASEKAGIVTALSKSFTVALQSLMLGLGALLVLDNTITPGMMIAGSILLGRAIAPVQLLISVWKTIGSTRSAYERLTELLEHNPAREAGMALPKPKGAIAVENVTAIPPGGKVPVIKGLAFSIAAGEVLWRYYPSGSGKSTWRLLVGVWPAAAGKVRLDGADVYLWNKDELGRISDTCHKISNYLPVLFPRISHASEKLMLIRSFWLPDGQVFMK